MVYFNKSQNVIIPRGQKEYLKLSRFYGDKIRVTINVISGNGNLYISNYNSKPNSQDNDMAVEYYEKDKTSLDSNRIWFDFDISKQKKGIYLSIEAKEYTVLDIYISDA